MKRGQKIDIIIAHEENMKWFKDEVQAFEEAQSRDDVIAKAMHQDHKEEWNYGPLKNRRSQYIKVRDRIRHELYPEIYPKEVV